MWSNTILALFAALLLGYLPWPAGFAAAGKWGLPAKGKPGPSVAK